MDSHDEEDLLSNSTYQYILSNKFSLIRFLILKFLPILFYFLFFKKFLFSIFSILILIEFWINKNIDGLELIGFKWFFIFENNELKICYYSREDPFIPIPINYFFFWFISYLNIIIWIIILFFIIFFSSFNSFFIFPLIELMFNIINIYHFFQCKKENLKHYDEVARAVLLGDVFNSDSL